MKRWIWTLTTLVVIGVATASAQSPGNRGDRGRPEGQPGDRGGPDGPGRNGPPPPNPIVAALDADHDHVISSDEIKNASAALLTLDKNSDGKLTEDEFRPGPGRGGPDGDRPNGPGGNRNARGSGLGSSKNAPARGGNDARRGSSGPGGGPGGPPPNTDRFVAHAMSFDADKDGKLSQQELARFAEEMQRNPPPGGPRDPAGRPNDEERPERPRRPE